MCPRGLLISIVPLGDHVDATAFAPTPGLTNPPSSTQVNRLVICLQFRWRRIDRWFPKDSAEKYSVLENCEDSTRATIMALDHKRASRLSPPLKDGHWRGAGEGKVTPRSKIPEVQNECVGETSHGFDYACSVNGVRSRS